MTEMATEPITGWAAGVPFTALPPVSAGAGPLVVAWHMMDPPRSDAGFAALLPLWGVPAWRVYLGMPLVGRRPVEGTAEAVQADPMLRYIDPVVRQATEEFPAALDELRERFPIAPGPIGVVGASLGGTVALNVLHRALTPISAAVLVNPAIRARTAVEMVAAASGTPYPWSDESQAAADRLDFVARAGLIGGHGAQPAMLVINGELDDPTSRDDAFALRQILGERYQEPNRVALTTVAGLGHSLLDPRMAKLVDNAATAWLNKHLVA